jgi:putative addiction module component (TIGR02574 family)
MIMSITMPDTTDSPRLHGLWDSLTPEDGPLEEWQQRLLDERLDAHERDPEAARPWEDVRDEVFPLRR